jgi:chromosomal replication initiator protein
MTHYQEIHLLKQELRRQRLLLIEQKNNYEKMIQSLKREILRPKIDITRNKAQWEDVMRSICQIWDITPDDIYSHNRQQHVLYARHTFNYICRKTLRMSFESIGRIINRDHSTIIHSVRQTQDLIEYDRQFAKTHQQTLELLDSYSNEESIVVDTHTERRERCVAYEEEI